MVLTVLAFNLGMETMQLVVVGLIVPWLILVSRTPFYKPIRLAGAYFRRLAAIGWIAQRAVNLPNPMDAVVVFIAAHALWLVLALALLAIAATISSKVYNAAVNVAGGEAH